MRRLRSITYLLPLVAIMLMACRAPGPQALLEGERLIREGKYPEAIAQLQTATRLLATNAQAWNHLGLAHQYAGQPDDALRAYQQAISLDRNLAAVRFNLGTLHLEQGRMNEAINELATATVLEPGSIPAWVNLGKAQLRARRIDDAEKTFRAVLQADAKNVESWNYYGVTQLHRRKAREAVSAFNEALKLQADYSPAVLNQAVVSHYYIINKTNALAKYREYLGMKPDAAGAAAATEAARVLEAELRPKVAAVPPPATNAPVATNRVVAMTNRLATPTNIASARPEPRTNFAAITRPTNAVEMAAAPTNRVVATNRPIAAVTNRAPELALAQTNAVLPPKTNLVVAAAPVKIDEPPKVAEPVEPVKPLEVVNVDDETRFAVAKDIAPLKPAVTTTPPPVKPVEAAPKSDTNSVAVGEGGLIIRPARREPKEEKSSLLQKANPLNWFRRDKDEVKPEKEKVVAQKPELVESAVKDLPEPPKQPEPEVKPEPVFARYPYQTTPLPPAGKRALAEPLFNEAITAHQEGKLGKAMDGYRAALRQDARFFEAHLNLGIAAAQATDLSLALASLEDAVRLNPKSAEARYQFAMALRRANYPLDAVNELKTLIEETPNEARAYLALGNLYAQVLNKPEAATTNYQRVLELAPRHPQAGQIRAWLSQN